MEYDYGTNNDNKNNSQESEYSYSKEQINQGEAYYEWNPNNGKAPAPKKPPLGVRVGKVLAFILVILFVAAASFGGAYYFLNYQYEQGADSPKENKAEKQEKQENKHNKAGDNVKKTEGTVSNTKPGEVKVVDVSDLVDNVMPAIVQVTNNGVQQYQSFFGGVYEEETTSAGSGIIISQDEENLYIATNNHVVDGAKEIKITFSDEKDVQGEIKGTDSACDLAVVVVKLSDISDETIDAIKVASIGNSDDALVGDGCVVIGNAMGYGLSVTTGVISAKDCETEIQDNSGNTIYNSLIQTDAAVNPGNSGGALINEAGEVIGIVSAKLSSAAVEGMGYAIPISYASSIIDQMVTNDEVSELEASYLGIGGKDINKEVAEANKVPVGVYVAKVIEDSGAEAAGIEEGDIIIEINDRKVNSMNAIKNILKYLPAGETVEIKVVTKDSDYKDEKVYDVTLSHRFSEIN